MSEAKLKIMHDLMEKKRGLLEQVVAICENQGELLKAQEKAPKHNKETMEHFSDFFTGMGQEKQTIVDEITKTDDLFLKLYNEMGEDLQSASDTSKPIVKAMQLHVMAITDLDAKVRTTEARNLKAIERMQGKRRNTKKAYSQATKTRVIEHYKSHAFTEAIPKSKPKPQPQIEEKPEGPEKETWVTRVNREIIAIRDIINVFTKKKD